MPIFKLIFYHQNTMCLLTDNDYNNINNTVNTDKIK